MSGIYRQKNDATKYLREMYLGTFYCLRVDFSHFIQTIKGHVVVVVPSEWKQQKQQQFKLNAL